MALSHLSPLFGFGRFSPHAVNDGLRWTKKGPQLEAPIMDPDHLQASTREVLLVVFAPKDWRGGVDQ